MRVVKNKKIMLLSVGMFILGFLSGYAAITVKFTTTLSDDEIRTKFNCYRTTLDLRDTDVFCDPSLYRNPYLTETEYFARANCEALLKTPPTPAERTENASSAQLYDRCSDKTLLNQERIEFNTKTRLLRAKY